MKQHGIVLWLCALCASLAFTLTSFAQANPHPEYHPGQTVCYTVTFDHGRDVSKITSVVLATMTRNVSPSQPGFQNGLTLSASKKIGENQFEACSEVPKNQRSGVYTVMEIQATVTVANGYRATLSYHPPNDFNPIQFRIENPETIEKPKIKDVTQTP
jgi:hypothetical protein